MDETLRSLQRAAASGSEEAQKRYTWALERAIGISTNDPTIEVYEAKNRGWFPKDPPKTFPIEARIYREDHDGMLSIYLDNLKASVGFTLRGFPQEHWDWLLGSLSSQISVVAEQAYQKGREDARQDMRKALGL